MFNDYVAEIQRSIGYFSSVNRDAKITRVLGVGNGFKLAGLQKFLQQNLQHPVERVDQFKAAVGDEALGDATFKENVAGFVVPYGVALQAAGLTRITTSLVPPEIVRERKIRKKKPWAALAAGVLLAGASGTALGYGRYAASVSETRWGDAIREVDAFTGVVSGYQRDYEAEIALMKETEGVARQLTAPASGRSYWPEVLRAISAVTPGDPGAQLDVDVTKREEVRIKSVSFEKTPNLAAWYAALPDLTKEVMREMAEAEAEERARAERVRIAAEYAAATAAAEASGEEPPPPPPELQAPADDAAADGADAEPAAEGEVPAGAPEGEGYVVTLRGVHYHHGDTPAERDAGYLRNTILKNLRQWTIDTAVGEVPVGKLGISHPALLPIVARKFLYDPQGRTVIGMPADRGPRTGPGRFGGDDDEDGRGPFRAPVRPYGGDEDGGRGGPAGAPPVNLGQFDADQPAPEYVEIDEYPFTIQFVWKKTPPELRPEEPGGPPPGGEPVAAE